MKTKQAKAQRIAELERQLHEAKVAQVHTYHFASKGLDKLSTDCLMGSGVILSMMVLGGRTTFVSIRQRDGADPDDWHWVLIHKDEVEDFISQVRQEAVAAEETE